MSAVCERCGAFGDMPHSWVEADCVLPHKGHSRKLVDGAHVCVPCVERWGDWLQEITDLYATLGTVMLAGDVPDDTAEHKRARKQPASPSPIRLDAWALAHPWLLNDHVTDQDGTTHAAYLGANLPNVPAVLAAWAQDCYDAQGFTATAPDTVTGAAAVLRGHGETMARLPEVDDYDAELRWVRKALRQAHGITNPQPICACISVGCKGHVWPNHGEQPRCDRCGRRYGTLDLVRAKAPDKREMRA